MSTVKLPLLKKGEYDIWAMKMEHYLAHTDYPIWEVIQKGNGPVSVTTDTQGVVKVLPPKTAEEILARERERKARTTLLMAILDDHLAKFHRMTDTKDIWDAIKTRFGGNDESKKMQKYILKQQFEGFTISNSEGLHKGYDRFQSLLSQLEVHGARVSTEDANQKFLRSLPLAWSQVSLVMRTKQGINDLSFDDLYNNLRVFESDIKGLNTSSSSSPNVAFHNSKRETSSSYTDDLMYSFFANQSNGLQLDHEDLEQIDEYDLEEMDLKWQVAMISMRLNKFYKKTGRKLHFDEKKCCQDARRKDAGSYGYKVKDNGRRSGKKEEPNALVTLDGEGIDWTSHAEDGEEYFALMAFNNASSDTETYAQGLKKVEAQLVTHQNNQLWYEQKIRYMKIDLDDKTNVLTYHKKLLAEALKEKEDLNTKFENWQNSSKNLGKLLNTQMSASDKFGLGYGDHRFDGILSYENEVLQSVFINKDDNADDRTLNDRFVTTDGMHAVPPPMTWNYMPLGPDIEIDESQFTYGPKQPQSSEPDTRSSDFDSCESNSSVETLDCMPVPIVIEPKAVSTPKVWTDAPIIEKYESDSDDECVIAPSSEQEQPRETVQKHKTSSQSSKVKKKDLNSTARGKAVSAVRGNGKTIVKASAGCIWRPKRYYDDPQRALKNKGIVDSGCSRHMTGNKGYLQYLYSQSLSLIVSLDLFKGL
ncbi:hypothetical protein Tco_0927441 [Tanacetum coccineum]